MPGRIRVGRSKYVGGRVIPPTYPGFTPIPVLTQKFGKYYVLCPYDLRNEQGQIIENCWQAKVYASVPQVSVPYSSGDSRIVWSWPAEVHIDAQGNPNEAYWRWRQALKNNPYPVRAPVGWKHLKTCLFNLVKDEPPSATNPPLNYIESRKAIYVPLYEQSVIHQPLFHELWNRYQQGENLLIYEVDGPHSEFLQYYQQNYGVPADFIDRDSIEARHDYLDIMLNDPKHPYGHGYCLARTLLNYQPTINEEYSMHEGPSIVLDIVE